MPELEKVRLSRKLDRKEMTLLLEELRQKPLNRLIGNFLFKMGLRVSELCSRNWGDIYEGIDGQLMLRVVGKANKERNLPIPEDLFSLLKEYRLSHGQTTTIGKALMNL